MKALSSNPKLKRKYSRSALQIVFDVYCFCLVRHVKYIDNLRESDEYAYVSFSIVRYITAPITLMLQSNTLRGSGKNVIFVFGWLIWSAKIGI